MASATIHADASTNDSPRCELHLLPLALALSLAFPAPTEPSAAVDDTILQKLLETLKDPDPDVRHNLSVSLAKIGPRAVEPLIRSLSDASSTRRAGAAYALGQIGRAARAALPALLDCLKDDDLSVRRQASYAISRILPTTVLPDPTLSRTEAKPASGGKP